MGAVYTERSMGNVSSQEYIAFRERLILKSYGQPTTEPRAISIHGTDRYCDLALLRTSYSGSGPLDEVQCLYSTRPIVECELLPSPWWDVAGRSSRVMWTNKHSISVPCSSAKIEVDGFALIKYERTGDEKVLYYSSFTSPSTLVLGDTLTIPAGQIQF
jgi:hypothetical protein